MNKEWMHITAETRAYNESPKISQTRHYTQSFHTTRNIYEPFQITLSICIALKNQTLLIAYHK